MRSTKKRCPSRGLGSAGSTALRVDARGCRRPGRIGLGHALGPVLGVLAHRAPRNALGRGDHRGIDQRARGVALGRRGRREDGGEMRAARREDESVTSLFLFGKSAAAFSPVATLRPRGCAPESPAVVAGRCRWRRRCGHPARGRLQLRRRRRRREDGELNVLVLIIDSLRPDHVGAYGSPADPDAEHRRARKPRPALLARLSGGDGHRAGAPLDLRQPADLPVPQLEAEPGDRHQPRLAADRRPAEDLHHGAQGRTATGRRR